MAIRRFEVELEGTAGLLLSNNLCSDPLSDAAKIKKHFTGKRTKADADHQNLRVIDWAYSGYWSTPGEVLIDDASNTVSFEGFADPYLPSQNFQRCLRNGATDFVHHLRYIYVFDLIGDASRSLAFLSLSSANPNKLFVGMVQQAVKGTTKTQKFRL